MGQGQGHFGKMGYSDCQTPNSFAMINIWHYYGHQSQSHLEVKIIVSSRLSFQGSKNGIATPSESERESDVALLGS